MKRSIKKTPVPVVFLDKDGTLVKDVPYNVDINKIKWAPYALSSLKRLAQKGYSFMIVTNQPGVALGLCEEKDVRKVGRYLARVFEDHGLNLLGFYYCPHHPQGTIDRYTRACLCRKPLSGLMTKASQEHVIDFSRSWLIGDILDDIECGRRCGCRTILINNGNETQWIKTRLRRPHAIAGHLKQAADYILKVQEHDE